MRKKTYKKTGKRRYSNAKRRRYTKAKPSRGFVSKVRKAMVRLGAVQFFDVAFASANMAAWSVSTLQDGQFQALDVMRQFFAVAVNGTSAVNTIGNRVYLMGCKIEGDIHFPMLTGYSADCTTDLQFRESILTPKDPYFSLVTVENSVANTTPAFNQSWQPGYGKVEDRWFTMGSNLFTIAGITTGFNIDKPSIVRINKYIRINKHLTDIYTYNTVGPTGATTLTPASELTRGNKIWTIAPQTIGNIVAAPKMQYTVRYYFKNYV